MERGAELRINGEVTNGSFGDPSGQPPMAYYQQSPEFTRDHLPVFGIEYLVRQQVPENPQIGTILTNDGLFGDT